jgi:tryptophan--tRNA ligase
MTQFKDKGKGRESVPTGLFTYPVLMAADILLYDTEVVPVGIDQKQHIELTRDLCNRVNNKYGDTFILPEGRYLKEGAKIMALDDPTKKMSKSAENELSRISLLDDDKKIKKAIMRATTDSDGVVKFDVENKPGISNLMNIYTAFSDLSIGQIEEKYKGKGYGDFKKDLVEIVIDGLKPFKERFEEIRNSQELVRILEDGEKRANEIAEKVLDRVKDKFGIGY